MLYRRHSNWFKTIWVSIVKDWFCVDYEIQAFIYRLSIIHSPDRIAKRIIFSNKYFEVSIDVSSEFSYLELQSAVPSAPGNKYFT